MADISKIRIGTNNYDIKDEAARSSIENIINQISSLVKNKKYVFMGDSYGDGYSPDGQVTSWITLLVNKLNLSSTDYISTHQGGYRFSYSSSDYNFIRLLQNLNDDNNLTDMYVCGGYNDLVATESDILLGIQNFNNLFKTKFPNAKLHIGFIGWTKNGTNIRNLAKTYLYYKRACNELNIDFLVGTEFSLHNYFKYFSSDGIHPNQAGQNSIASSIYNCIISGNANVYENEGFYFTINNGSISNSNTRMILNNGIVTAQINGGSNNATSITFNDVIELTGNTPVEIASITNSLAVGTDYNDCVFNGIPCIIFDGTTYSKETLDFIIKNSKLYVVGAFASQGSYQTKEIKSIQIPTCSLSISALSC